MQFVFFTLIPAYLFNALDLHHEFASLFDSHMYKAAFSPGFVTQSIFLKNYRCSLVLSMVIDIITLIIRFYFFSLKTLKEIN